MLGKITKSDIELQTKFVKLINLYAQLVFFNMLEEEFIEPIRDVFYDIAEEVEVNFQELYDAEIQTLESNNVQEPTKSIFDTLPEDRYVEIVKHSIAYELSKKYQNKVEKAVQSIQTLEDSVPDGMTKKAWSEKIKPQIEKLREERDTAKKMVTETKNNVNTDEVTKLAQERFISANGMVTNEEITMRLNHLLENVFYEEKQNEQFYPTPDDIVQKYIIDTLKKEQFTANPLVLEPSAGRGNIADAIRDAYPSARIDVCEINPLRREILELKNYNVVGDDFMKYGATRDESKGKNVLNDSVKNKYDFIVMNPPYNSGMDIRHVKRAFELLKPTGMIIAIISEGSAFSETRKDSVAFDLWLKDSGVVSKEYIDNKTYSNMLDRPIAIGIGVITIRKPFPVVKSNDEPTYTMPEIVTADTNYQLEIDKNFVDAKVITTNEHMITPPKFKGDQIMKKYGHLKWINDYVFFGVKKAIDSLDKDSGFLLADGTGAGKTIQCLMVAEHYYKKTGKPVLIFTVDDRVMQSGVFGDAEKLGMLVPDKINMDEDETKNKIPTRPKNYSGLYDKIIPKDKNYDNPVSVYAFNIKSPKLRDGINVTTYHNLSQWVGAEKETESVTRLGIEKKKIDKAYSQKIKDAKELLDKQFPKNPRTKRREPEGYKAALDEAISEIRTAQRNDPIYVQFLNAQKELTNARYDAMKKWCGDACLVIFDEAHKVKNTGTGDGDASSQRAELARAITESGERIMFVTATPCDRPGDLLYLKRAGLFKSDEQFQNLMAEIGVYWVEPKFNDRQEMIQFGRWDFSDMDTLGATKRLGEIFDTLYEDGNMLRRELEFRNLNVLMNNLTMPQNVLDLMDAIEETLTTEDDDGKEKKNLADIYNRQLEELEEHKLDEVIRLTNDAISRGRNVLIFVKSVDTGTEERAWSGKPKPGAVRILKEKFAKMYGEDKVGVIVGTHSEYEKYRRLENVKDFQSRKRRIMIGTPASGGTGLNLDDTVGNAPRTMIVVTFPLSFIDVVQIVGRIVRAKTKSVSECHFIFAGNVPVDKWLANLLAIKFATLHATVKGEVSALNVEQLREAEAGGESAAIANVKDNENVKTNHSRFRKSNVRIDGWALPSRVPLYVELSGTPKDTLISIGAKKDNQEYFTTWIANNQEFIEKYKLVKNPDSMHQKFNGRHYGRKFRDRDQCYALWNALLNVIDPETTYYNEPTKQIFKVGDAVVFSRSVGMYDVGYGTRGYIDAVRSLPLGKNADGLEIFEYRYDVKLGRGSSDPVVKRVNVSYLNFADAPPRIMIAPGSMFRQKNGSEYGDLPEGNNQKYLYYYLPKNAENQDANTYTFVRAISDVEYRKNYWGQNDWSKPLRITHPTEKDFINKNDNFTFTEEAIDIDDVLDDVKTAYWEIVSKNPFFTMDGTKKTNYEVEIVEEETLADNFSDTKEKFEKLVEIFTLAKEQRLIDDEAIEQIEAVIDEIASEMNIAHGSGEVERFVMEPYKKERIRDSRLKEYRRQKKTKQGRHTLDYSNGTQKHAYSSGGHVEIVGEDEKYNEERYGAIFEDYDGDGVVNIDDAYPTDPSKQGKVESVALQPVFKKLIELKEKLNSVMYKAVDDLQRKAPKTADIYARTKTPYSIVKKLVDKRLLDQAKGLTDLVGTTIATDSYQDLVKVKNEIDSGLLGKVVDYDDFYTNPKAGYMAHHYIVKTDDGYLVEIQLKTKRMKRVNKVSHEFYKLGNLNAEGNLAVTELAHQADLGNEKAIKRFNDIMSPKFADLLRDIMTGKRELQLEQENDDDDKKKIHKPIRQFSSGGNIYYESKTSTLRVNDYTDRYSDIKDKILLLVPGYGSLYPIKEIYFEKSDLDKAMQLAMQIDKRFPKGIHYFEKISTFSKYEFIDYVRKSQPITKLENYIYRRLKSQVFNGNRKDKELKRHQIRDAFLLSKNQHEDKALAEQALNIIYDITEKFPVMDYEAIVHYLEIRDLHDADNTFNGFNGVTTLSDTDLTQKGFYSRLDKAVQQLPEKVKKQSFLNTLKKSKEGVSSNELDLVNMNELLLLTQNETIKKDDILTFLNLYGYSIYEYVLGKSDNTVQVDGRSKYNAQTEIDAYESDDYEYYEYLYHLREKSGKWIVDTHYVSNHFNSLGTNLLGHYRCSYIEQQHGYKNCFIEEIQSDWSQDVDERESSPFGSVSSFIEFITKVIIVNAINNDTDTITYTSGEMQNKRWNKMYEPINKIYWNTVNDDGFKLYYVTVYLKSGKRLEEEEYTSGQIQQLFGSKVADEMSEKVFGELIFNQVAFYGNSSFIEMYGSTQQNTIGIIGKKFNDLLKPYGEKVTVQKFYDNDVFGFTIPKKLKEKIMNDEHSFSLMDGKTLTEKIKSNPYLKISNCTDIADIEAAMDDLRKLDAEYGEDNKTLLKLWNKFLEKKKKLEKENN